MLDTNARATTTAESDPVGSDPPDEEGSQLAELESDDALHDTGGRRDEGDAAQAAPADEPARADGPLPEASARADAPFVRQAHIGSTGMHVAAYQRMLHRWNVHVRPYWASPSEAHAYFGDPMRKQVRQFQQAWSDAHPGDRVEPTGLIGPRTHARLLPSADERARYLLRKAYDQEHPVVTGRQIVVDAALLALKHQGHMTYSGPHTSSIGRRWQGISEQIAPPSVPQYADCSSLCTWLLWLARDHGAHDPSADDWRYGDTETMIQHGTKRTVEAAQPGDMFHYYRPDWGGHVAVMVGRSQGVPWLVSFGQQGGPYYVRYDYRHYHGRVDLRGVWSYVDG
jgi:hypothetical protein